MRFLQKLGSKQAVIRKLGSEWVFRAFSELVPTRPDSFLLETRLESSVKSSECRALILLVSSMVLQFIQKRSRNILILKKWQKMLHFYNNEKRTWYKVSLFNNIRQQLWNFCILRQLVNGCIYGRYQEESGFESTSTMCFTDWGKLNLPMVVQVESQANLHYSPSCL